MEGVPVTGTQDELAIPREVTVQIIHDPAMLAGSGAQLVTSLGSAVYTSEAAGAGAAQTVLNIGQPQIVKFGQLVPEAGSEGLVLADGGVTLGVSGGGGHLGGPGGEDSKLLLKEDEHSLAEERSKVAEDIRMQMRELCNQLADVGEECYMVSVRVEDGNYDHLGSIKGDHYCLLRQEMLHDFRDFCMGVESGDKVEDDDEEDELAKLAEAGNHGNQDSQEEQDTSMAEEEGEPAPGEEEEEEEMETDSSSALDTEPPAKNAAIVPKVIVLKKDAKGKKVSVDHQYTVQGGKQKPAGTQPGTQPDQSKTGARLTTNILFLCDICKEVFNDVKDLREHKLAVHDEGDYKCTQCPRVFTLRKTLERHLCDAHTAEDGSGAGAEDRFICDTCVMDFRSRDDLVNHITAVHDPELPMKCDVCEQTFPDILHMMDHRKIHFDYDCFCNKCWQGFFDYLELETHIQTNCRYKEALYKCDICGKRYTKLAAVNKHIDTHPIHSPHVCRMCGRGFETEKDLRYHRTASHIIRPFKCEFCEKTFKKKESLIEHRRIHLRVKKFSINDLVSLNGQLPRELTIDGDEEHFENVVENEFECSLCGIVLSSEGNLAQHMHQHETATEQHKCERCSKVFFSHSLLTVHCRKEHKIFLNSREDSTSVVTDMLACNWEGCSKTFYDRAKWRYHMKYHEQRAEKIALGMPLTPQQASTTCEICGKVLKYKSYLKAHMMTHSKEQPHQCDLCGQAYTNAKRLQDHIRVHKGDKPFKCRVCEKAFTSTSLRNQHMVIHWGHKTYICDVCGKGFMSRKHFHDHMRIHNGEQPHRCDTCGKDFIYYRSLVRHALTHIDPKSRPKPYKCQYCGKEYTEVTGYKHHMRSVHTGETPFQCDICGDAFHRNDKLKRHMKSRHNKSELKAGLAGMTHIVTTKRGGQGVPILVKTETEGGAGVGELGVEGQPNELHVDVIQQVEGAGAGGGAQQVFLIGLGGQDGGETTYLQETQVIEGPDGVRYIIAGSGEELQVIESSSVQQIQEGDIIEGDIIQQIGQDAGESIMVLNEGGSSGGGDGVTLSGDDQETLATLANMASVAEVADIVQNVE